MLMYRDTAADRAAFINTSVTVGVVCVVWGTSKLRVIKVGAVANGGAIVVDAAIVGQGVGVGSRCWCWRWG